MDKYYYKEYAEEAGLDSELVHKVMQNLWLSIRQEILSKPDVSYGGFVIQNFITFNIKKDLTRRIENIGSSNLSDENKVMYLKVFRLVNALNKKKKKIQKEKRKKILNRDNKISRAIRKYKEENK